jgi:hypothetical protein
MKAYGGPAQPSPMIGQCLNGGYGWLQGKYRRCETEASIPLCVGIPILRSLLDSRPKSPDIPAILSHQKGQLAIVTKRGAGCGGRWRHG